MNLLEEISDDSKAVKAQSIFNEIGSVTLIKIQKGKVLTDHQSKSNAMLILLEGEINYNEENNSIHLKRPNDFIRIPAKITHNVEALENSTFMLVH